MREKKTPAHPAANFNGRGPGGRPTDEEQQQRGNEEHYTFGGSGRFGLSTARKCEI